MKLGFPTGRDSVTFRDKGTEVPSLSRDKWTTGQAENLAMGWDATGRAGTRDGTITIREPLLYIASAFLESALVKRN